MSTARTCSAGFTLVLVVSLLVLVPPAAAGGIRAIADANAPSSANGIRVIENSVEHSFAQHVTFTLEASSDAEISEVYLFFRAIHDEATEKKRVSLEDPSQDVSLEVRHDAMRYPLPPFAEITYWWQITNAAGQELKTPPQQFTYHDNRFSWDRLSGDGITIHWMTGDGDPAFAQTALDIARASVRDIEAELRGSKPDPLEVFIYDSEANLQGAMVLTGRDWVAGQARPELGVVVVAVPEAQGYTSRMKRYLPHEITHLLLYELVTPNGYTYVPTWLNEGLATANERLPTPEYALVLEKARRAGELIPLEDLCVPFSPDAQTATLSYAQSGSLVSFIREEHGAQGIRQLLAAYADGASCKSGVEEGLGVTFRELEADWQMSLNPDSGWRTLLDKVGLWIVVPIIGLLLAVPMMGGLRRRSKELPTEGEGAELKRVS